MAGNAPVAPKPTVRFRLISIDHALMSTFDPERTLRPTHLRVIRDVVFAYLADFELLKAQS